MNHFHVRQFLAAIVLSATVSAQHRLSGPNWSAVIGADGLLQSFVAADEEMLAPFPGTNAPAMVRIGNEPEPLTVRRDNDRVIAESTNLKLAYAVADNQLQLICQSLVTGKTATLFWRPAPAVTRAFDGEDDTMVDTLKTWCDDMVDGRWVSTSGNILTVRGRGDWTREPYTAEGTPCFRVTLYPRNRTEYRFIAESQPGPERPAPDISAPPADRLIRGRNG